MTDASARLDARLLATDLTAMLQRRCSMWLPSRWSTTAARPIDTLHELQHALLDAGLDPDGEVIASVTAAAGAPLPLLPLPFVAASWRAAQRQALEQVSALLEDLDEGPDDGWRELEPSARRGRFRSRNARQSYSANVSAG